MSRYYVKEFDGYYEDGCTEKFKWVRTTIGSLIHWFEDWNILDKEMVTEEHLRAYEEETGEEYVRVPKTFHAFIEYEKEIGELIETA